MNSGFRNGTRSATALHAECANWFRGADMNLARVRGRECRDRASALTARPGYRPRASSGPRIQEAGAPIPPARRDDTGALDVGARFFDHARVLSTSGRALGTRPDRPLERRQCCGLNLCKAVRLTLVSMRAQTDPSYCYRSLRFGGPSPPLSPSLGEGRPSRRYSH